MDSSNKGQDSLSPAEAALLEYLAQRDEPQALDLDAFCAARPALAAELRRRHDEWLKLAALVGDLRAHTTLQARLARHFGPGLDPAVALQPDEGATGAPSEIPKRVARQGARYELRAEIARGGMGVIVKVWDRDVRRHSAMKVALSRTREGAPDPTKPADRLVIARFLEEAQITGQLEHPGIAPVHEIGVDDQSRVYFTMPLIRGRDLKQVIELARAGREGWNRTRALGVFLKICEAVGYAHSRRVLHRDLKPGNVMVGRFGETYVMDWGLARVLDREDGRDLRLQPLPEQSLSAVHTDRRDELAASPDSPLITMDGQVVGTPSYMSPEQARGAVDAVGPRSDVYSIGAMLYQLLCGEMPYVPAGVKVTPHTVLAALLHGPPRPVREIDPDAPAELVDICEKAMSIEAERRYATALELARDIEAYLGDRPVAAHEPSLGYALELVYRRNRAVTLTTAAALLVLIVVGALFMRRESAAQQEIAEATRRSDELMYARALPAQADELHPALPNAIPALEAWLANVDRLLQRRAAWSRGESLAPDVAANREFMGHAFERLDALRPVIVERIAFARALANPDAHGRRAAWERAHAAIAAAPRYGGLRVAPVEWLVPLGPDSSTGLWEFWNVLSGAAPEWDAATGLGTPRASDAVVLVLLPGGTFAMGSSDEEDPWSEIGEEQHAVLVAPVYVAKYEVTQAQWMRLMGENPSLFRADVELTATTGIRIDIDERHPVESIDWYQADEFARRIGHTLLSIEQWEYACRAGTTTPWIWGDTIADLEGQLNLSDLTAELAGIARNADAQAVDWHDGHAVTAPVGSYPANDFGLHDMDGNVSEWCASWREEDWLAPQEPRRRHFRGGSLVQAPKICRCAQPQFDLPRGANFARGLRLALEAPLEP